ncbi:MAG: spore germination protein [Firmicutes bacterium]|nr:spore germination protein [Candidatus Fermentithermobacillaceae bacterium]
MPKKVKVKEAFIRQAFGNSSDLVVRELHVGPGGKFTVLMVYLDGLVDKAIISENMIERISDRADRCRTPGQAYDDLKNRIIAVSDVKETGNLYDFLNYVARGYCGLVMDDVPKALVADTRGWAQRNIEEPTTEATIRGAKEGFVETLRTNTALLRRRVKHPRLRIEEYDIGTISKTSVAVAYISGLADEKVVQEVRNRLGRINVDSIQESGQVEELIEDAPFSPFPTILRTERPDKVAGALFEGRIAILTDGTPFVLIVPVTLTMFLTTPEDYFERTFIGSALRAIRYLAFFTSLTLPSLYVAVTTFHQEMLPTPLVLNIASQREGVPFPAVVEALLMEVLFEILREAGVRLPKIVGPAVSIIGALVIGEAAMRAGLVSPIMVVVVATTGIASFATPVFSLAIGARLLRFIMLLLAGSLGFFGIVAGLFGLAIHLTSLRSFGVPFMEPIAPILVSEFKDLLARVPWWAMHTRPALVGHEDLVRQGRDQKPGAPDSPSRRLADKKQI